MDYWLIAVAVVVAVSFVAYTTASVLGTRKIQIDFNQVVPMSLEAAGAVAAVKMIVLSFRLASVVQASPVSTIFDAGSILVGGFVFLLATTWGIIRIVAAAYTGEES